MLVAMCSERLNSADSGLVMPWCLDSFAGGIEVHLLQQHCTCVIESTVLSEHLNIRK